MTRWKQLVPMLLSALVPLLSLSAQPPSDPSRLFGIVEGYYRPAEAAALPASWDRVIFTWSRFQPNGPDEFDAAAVPDSIPAEAAAANRQIVGLIKGTPAWASATGSPAAVPNGLDLPLDDPGNTFAAFVRRLVAHYAPLGVHHWVIWNEPDIRPGEGTVEFEGEVSDYARLLSTAYRAIKAADPSAHVQMAGLTWWYDVSAYREPFLARVLAELRALPDARANGSFFDGISLHIYFTTDSVSDIIGAHRRILSAYGLSNKDVWMSEFNASPRRDPAAAIGSPFQVSLEQQADFIVQAAAQALAGGVDRMAVYRLWDNDFVPGVSEPWGLLRADGSARPAYAAYQQVIQRFSGATDADYATGGGGALVTLTRPGSTVYVMWSTGPEPGEFTIQAGDSPGLQVADATGVLTPAFFDGATAIIPAPGAEMIDMNFVVVDGPVRLIELPGAPRSVTYSGASGRFTLR